MDNQKLLQEIRKIMKEELKNVNGRIDKIDGRLDNMEGRMDEQYKILRALKHSAEVNKSTDDAMQNDIAHIKGYVEYIKGKISTVEADIVLR